MKYINFKRYNFYKITKKINAIRYGFYEALDFAIYVFIKFKKYLSLKIRHSFYGFTNLGIYVFSKYKKYLSFKKFYKYLNFTRLYEYINFKKYAFVTIRKNISLKRYKNLPTYLFIFTIFIGFLYVSIPIFYSYDISKIEQAICKNKNIECSIKGKVNYSFYPTPRIKIKDLKIYNSFTKEKAMITVNDAAIKLSIKNLIIKKKQTFKKLVFKNFKINIDLKGWQQYKNIFEQNVNFIPITFTKGEIIFLDKNDYVVSIYDARINLILDESSNDTTIKGKFLEDNIYISLNTKEVDKKLSTDIILKMSNLNLLTQVKFFNSEKNKNFITGDILIKKGKQKFTGIFNYKNNEITINKSNLRNQFFDGKLNGTIKFLPFFNFNLDLNLNSLNFTKLYNSFLALDEKKQKNFFRINKKINGKLSVATDRVYSSYNLIKSFESRVKFNNGNISVEQFLINLGKLGAGDISGKVNNDEKFSNFKYESNIFIDNQKKFLSKFGVYNKESISSNLFIAGSFDLQNAKGTFYEILNKEKLPAEDVNFIEQEFNDYMLEDGYKSLFRFAKFKEFIKSVTIKEN